MELTEFGIGMEFTCGDTRWRVTDIGTRTVVAIRIDAIEVTETKRHPDGSYRPVNRTVENPNDDWFRGPPYAVSEVVFDEDDMPICTPA